MKKKFFLFLGIFLLFTLFLFTTIYFTNKTIEEVYKKNFHNNFNLLIPLIDHYIKGEKDLVELKLKEITKRVFHGIKTYKKIEDFLDNYFIQGIWFIKGENIRGKTYLKEYEREIISFYKRNLNNKNTTTLITVDENSYLLINIFLDTLNILIVSEVRGLSLTELNKIFNSLFLLSEMVYFSVLDNEENPIFYTSVYEDFLPLKGEGVHLIKTPIGKIYHIERTFEEKKYVGGFSLESLNNFKLRSVIIIFVLILILGVFEIFTFLGILNFEKFKVRKEKEVESLKEISAISSGFAHEIRNSLNTLSLFSKTLNNKGGEILQEEVRRMKRIMDAMKVLTKSEPKREKINLKELIEDCIVYLKEGIEGLNISLNMSKKEVVLADRDLLFIAFNNMIKNSFEADARNLKIWSERKRGYRIINFMDDGKKIAIDEIKKIFEPFFSTKNQTGLGLYLTKKIVEIHGGYIQIYQNKEKIFKIYLPEK